MWRQRRRRRKEKKKKKKEGGTLWMRRGKRKQRSFVLFVFSMGFCEIQDLNNWQATAQPTLTLELIHRIHPVWTATVWCQHNSTNLKSPAGPTCNQAAGAITTASSYQNFALEKSHQNCSFLPELCTQKEPSELLLLTRTMHSKRAIRTAASYQNFALKKSHQNCFFLPELCTEKEPSELLLLTRTLHSKRAIRTASSYQNYALEKLTLQEKVQWGHLNYFVWFKQGSQWGTVCASLTY